MTFLNGLLAFGTLAFTIPLAIHLFHRSRFRTVDWGAMHLLDSVIQVNHRRMRLEQLILLLVRCAIPILLALCLARPVLTGSQSLPGSEPTSLVLLIDDSYSTLRQSGDGTVLARGIEQSRELIAALPQGSEVMVVAGGGAPHPLSDSPQVDLQQADQSLDQLTGDAGSVEVPAWLEAASVALAGTRNARRELVVLSDFQQRDWQAVSDDALRQFRRRWDQLPLVPSVTLLPLVDSGPAPANVSVEGLQVDSETVAVDETLRVRTAVRNRSERVYEGLKVRLLVDGQPQTGTSITVQPGETHEVLLTHAFDQPGSHLLECEVIADDVLPADNRRHVAISVLETIDVLLVDGAPSDKPLGGETDYLVVAMSPFAFSQQPLSDLLRARTIAPSQWKEDTTSSPRVVVLANVRKLEQWQVDWLAGFVRGGGGLMIFTGDQVDHEWYNKTLGPDGANLLPMEIAASQTVQPASGDPAVTSDAAPAPDEPSARRIVSQFFEHPSMQLFNSSSAGNLSEGAVARWNSLRPFEHPAPDSAPGSSKLAGCGPAVVVIQLDNGDPLVVERTIGDGVTMLVATAADADDSNLPLRPFYVPLVQEWMTWIATRGSLPRNIQVGDTASAEVPAEAASQPLEWWTPSGRKQPLQAIVRGERAFAETTDTRLRGAYTLRGEAIDPVVFSVQADSRESGLERASDKSLQHVAGLLNAQIAASSESYLAADRAERYGREIWRPLLWVLLAFLVLEMVLQQRFARVQA